VARAAAAAPAKPKQPHPHPASHDPSRQVRRPNAGGSLGRRPPGHLRELPDSSTPRSPSQPRRSCTLQVHSPTMAVKACLVLALALLVSTAQVCPLGVLGAHRSLAVPALCLWGWCRLRGGTVCWLAGLRRPPRGRQPRQPNHPAVAALPLNVSLRVLCCCCCCCRCCCCCILGEAGLPPVLGAGVEWRRLRCRPSQGDEVPQGPQARHVSEDPRLPWVPLAQPACSCGSGMLLWPLRAPHGPSPRAPPVPLPAQCHVCDCR
jgi:hypothetical protein